MPSHATVDAAKVDSNILARKPMATDMRKLGHLLVEIALGNVDMPGSTDETATLLKKHGVEIPKGVKVEMRVRDPEHMIIMIPPKQMVEAAVCEARKLDSRNVSYIDAMLPDYKDALTGAWYAEGKTNEDFYDVRVADYSLSFCR